MCVSVISPESFETERNLHIYTDTHTEIAYENEVCRKKRSLTFICDEIQLTKMFSIKNNLK